MRTVFTNHMVAHVWAQQNQPHGRSGNGQFFFDGPTIYSYRRSYPIAHFTGAGHRIGHFTLDKIEPNGDCKVGCHRLNFAEMTRLAIKEVPHLVRPAYPLPVVMS